MLFYIIMKEKYLWAKDKIARQKSEYRIVFDQQRSVNQIQFVGNGAAERKKTAWIPPAAYLGDEQNDWDAKQNPLRRMYYGNQDVRQIEAVTKSRSEPELQKENRRDRYPCVNQNRIASFAQERFHGGAAIGQPASKGKCRKMVKRTKGKYRCSSQNIKKKSEKRHSAQSFDDTWISHEKHESDVENQQKRYEPSCIVQKSYGFIEI